MERIHIEARSAFSQSGMTMTSCRKRRICGDGVSDVLANQQLQHTGMVQSDIQRARLFASAMPIRVKAADPQAHLGAWRILPEDSVKRSVI